AARGRTRRAAAWAGRLLWGRLYAGRRSRGHAPGCAPAPVGRDKPGPTSPIPPAALARLTSTSTPAPWQPCAVGSRSAALRAGRLFWGRLYAGRRSRGHAPGCAPAPVGRDKPGPTSPIPPAAIARRTSTSTPAPWQPCAVGPCRAAVRAGRLLWGRRRAAWRRRGQMPGFGPAPVSADTPGPTSRQPPVV